MWGDRLAAVLSYWMDSFAQEDKVLPYTMPAAATPPPPPTRQLPTNNTHHRPSATPAPATTPRARPMHLQLASKFDDSKAQLLDETKVLSHLSPPALH